MPEGTILDFNSYRARELVEDGKHYISIGDLDRAVETFQKSLTFAESAEGLTYLGWVLGLKGETTSSIELCKKAIALDPDYGNPYNDIGSYLIREQKYDEAIPWLEKAKLAPKFEPKHFPYINLGRIYSAQGHITQAISEFKKALEISPGHPEIERVLEQLEKLRDETL